MPEKQLVFHVELLSVLFFVLIQKELVGDYKGVIFLADDSVLNLIQVVAFEVHLVAEKLVKDVLLNVEVVLLELRAGKNNRVDVFPGKPRVPFYVSNLDSLERVNPEDLSDQVLGLLADMARDFKVRGTNSFD